MGLIVPYVGGVEQRMKPQPTFSVNVRLWTDMYIWVPFSWNQRILRVKVRGPSGTGLS
jgi:hypothetical protein